MPSLCQYVSSRPSRSSSTPLPGLALVTLQTAMCPISRVPVSGCSTATTATGRGWSIHGKSGGGGGSGQTGGRALRPHLSLSSEQPSAAAPHPLGVFVRSGKKLIGGLAERGHCTPDACLEKRNLLPECEMAISRGARICCTSEVAHARRSTRCSVIDNRGSVELAV